MSSILRSIVLQKKRPNYPILPYVYIYIVLFLHDSQPDSSLLPLTSPRPCNGVVILITDVCMYLFGESRNGMDVTQSLMR